MQLRRQDSSPRRQRDGFPKREEGKCDISTVAPTTRQLVCAEEDEEDEDEEETRGDEEATAWQKSGETISQIKFESKPEPKPQRRPLQERNMSGTKGRMSRGPGPKNRGR